jgi:uncharacterized membrane protein
MEFMLLAVLVTVAYLINGMWGIWYLFMFFCAFIGCGILAIAIIEEFWARVWDACPKLRQWMQERNLSL